MNFRLFPHMVDTCFVAFPDVCWLRVLEEGLQMADDFHKISSVKPPNYPLVNKQLDPENNHLLMETSLPTPICQGLC